MESHYHGVVHGCSACFVSVHYFRLSCVPKSCQHSIQFLCLTMRLIDIITYFSKYLASLIYFPTNWILITMWLSMDADIVSSVSIIFDYHVSLNLANILYNFCVSQWSSSIVFHTFQSISHHWFFPYELETHYHVVLHGCRYCFVSVHYFRLSCVPKSCQHSIQFLCLTMKLIDSIPYFSKYLASLIFSLRIGFSLPCGCPWMQYLFRQCPLFSIIMCP